MKRAAIKRNILLAAMSTVFCLANFSFPYFIPFADASPFEAEEKIQRGSFIRVDGLPPGSNVSYQIFSADEQSQVGEGTADSKGVALLPDFNLSESNRIYHLVINSDQRFEPFSITMRFDPETKKISFSGAGFDEFTGIAFEKESGLRSIKTDWAGSFSEKGLLDINDLQGPQSFKIAFQNHNLATDGTPDKSSIIQVQASIDPIAEATKRFDEFLSNFDFSGIGGGFGGSGGGGLGGGGFGGLGGGGSDCFGTGLIADGGGGPTSEGVNQFIPATNKCLSTSNQSAIQGILDKIVENYVTAFMMMGEQLSAVMIQQVEIIGAMLDAKHQLESQRILQQLQAQAHKDYHPSDQMCRFGTFVRSVAQAESKSRIDQKQLNEILMARYLNTVNSSSAEGSAIDTDARLKQFREVYCDPKDNNDGLAYMCDHDGNFGGGQVGGTNLDRLNKDIDYSRTIDYPLTLDGETFVDVKTEDLEDVIALGKNLYWPHVMEPVADKALLEKYHSHQDFRRIIAAQSIAHNTYAAIFGLKNRTLNLQGVDSGWAYMKAMLEEFEFQDASANDYLGDAPSYYAQMEVLTKKIYQHPDFYTNLYDKPANVSRIGVSMQAIDLMQQRDHFESLLRREMLLSLLVEQELLKHAEEVNVEMFSGMKANQRP